MQKLTPAEQRALRARAHALNPVVIISERGLSDAVLKEIDRSLKAHELIKIRVFSDDRSERAAIMDAICAHLKALPVQHIGKILVMYRKNPNAVEESTVPSRTAAQRAIKNKSVQPRRRTAPRSATAVPRTNPLARRRKV